MGRTSSQGNSTPHKSHPSVITCSEIVEIKNTSCENVPTTNSIYDIQKHKHVYILSNEKTSKNKTRHFVQRYDFSLITEYSPIVRHTGLLADFDSVCISKQQTALVKTIGVLITYIVHNHSTCQSNGQYTVQNDLHLQSLTLCSMAYRVYTLVWTYVLAISNHKLPIYGKKILSQKS